MPFALLDADGAVIQDDYMSFPYSDVGNAETCALGLMIAQRDGWVGYLSWSGGWAVEPQFVEARNFQEGRALAMTKDHLYGFIDPEGSFAVEPAFGSASEFHEGLAAVNAETESWYASKWGYVRSDGSIAVEPQFEWRTTSRAASPWPGRMERRAQSTPPARR